MGIQEKIKEVEDEIARTQKNKATEGHLGGLKAKLAKYRREALEGPKSGGNSTDRSFEVVKHGDARVAVIGFPSTGKSTFLSAVTETKSEAASYEFTTLKCVPGTLHHKGASIQLLDLPGIIEGAAEGKGRGRQVISVARSADLILIMLDATKSDAQRNLLEKELETVGIRLNKKPPDVYYKPKKVGGITFSTTLPLTKMTEKDALDVLRQYKVHNAELLIREDITVEQLIDVVDGSAQYIKCLYLYSKIDAVSLEEVDRLARQPNSVVMSCYLSLNLAYVIEKIWAHLDLCRVYTRKPGANPDFDDPIILRGGSKVEDACRAVHRNLANPGQFKYALVWGKSTKHDSQRVGLTHELWDEDVIQIVSR